MWQDALWGLIGAASNIGVVFLEASRRVKGWPWACPKGPGGDVYAVMIIIQLGIASATTAAVSTTGIVANPFIAFGMGAAAPVVVKKVAKYVESLLPHNDGDGESRLDGGADDAS